MPRDSGPPAGDQPDRLRAVTDLLRLLGSDMPRERMLAGLLESMRRWSGCGAVAIRLRQGDDFPYCQTSGFPEAFVALENSLCPGSTGRFTESGEPLLECMCGNVIQGRTDPSKAFFTPFGSFWTNGTTELLATTTEEDRQGRTRNRCNTAGFESVALVPLRFGGRCHGLLQFNDHEPGRFDPALLEFLECLAESVALWLSRRELEEGRAELEEQAEALFETGNAVRLLVDPTDGRILRANRQAVEFYGYSMDQLTSMRITQINEDVPGEVRRRMRSLVTGEATGPFFFQHRLADGTTREVEVHSRPMTYKGRLVLFSIVLDLTERRRAEEHVQSMARFPGENPNPVLRLGADLKVLYANKPGQRMLQLGQCAGGTPFAEAAAREARQALETGRMRRFEVFFGHRTFVFQVKPVAGSGYANLYGSDVTKLKRALSSLTASQESLRRREALLGALIRSLPFDFWARDRDMRLTMQSRESVRIWGDLTGRPFEDATIPEETRAVWRRDNAKALAGGVLETEYYQALPTGDQRFVRAVLGPVVLAGGKAPEDVIGILGVNVDLTERVKAEEALKVARSQAEEASRAKSVFLANMSHEIRTPLNGLMGMMQLLDMTPLSSEQREYTAMARRAGERLSSLLSDILDLSRIEAGRLALQEAEFATASLLAAVRETFAPMSAERGIPLVVESAPNTPSRLVGDEIRVRQILLNLVGNAMKFSKSGEVRVHVGPLLAPPGGGARLLFAVSDQGIGMEPELLNAIFEPFTQGPGGLERGQQGAGLGLAITKRLVQAMRGNLSMESAPGQGTTAYLVLPFRLPSASVQEPGLGLAGTGQGPKGLRILLAEDDLVSQLGTGALLRRMGHTVAVAGNGREALDILAAQPVDLVLMDVQMPEMDGLEALRRIRAGLDARIAPDLPVVALTAYAMAGDRERMLDAGMTGYLAKPFELADLGRVIQEAVAAGRKD